MQVKELKQDGLSHELEVIISANEIDSRIEGRLQEVGKTVRIPGFRPGKVPMNILKKRYGRAVMGEVLELAVNETSSKALKDKNIRPAMQPKIEVKEFDDGKDLKYTVSVESVPEFDVMDLKGIKLHRMTAKPEDKAVDDALENLAKRQEKTVKVETARKAKEGDTLVIDFQGRTAKDNKEHAGMDAKGHRLKLGSGMFIPGFEEQLTGAKAGESVEVKVTFPENYGAQELAGQEAIFDVTVQELHEPGEAAIDEDLAKSFGFEKLDDLRKAVAEQLQQELDSQSRLYLKKDLLDALDDGHDFAVPPTMLEMEYGNIVKQLEQERQQQDGDKAKPLDESEQKEFREIADRRVRLGLILAEVGSKSKIQIADHEMQQAVVREAQRYPGQEREVFEFYSKNRQALESLRAPLFEEKVVDYILELADVQEKPVSAEELMKYPLDGEDEKAEAKAKPKKASSTKAKTPSKKKSA